MIPGGHVFLVKIQLIVIW